MKGPPACRCPEHSAASGEVSGTSRVPLRDVLQHKNGRAPTVALCHALTHMQRHLTTLVCLGLLTGCGSGSDPQSAAGGEGATRAALAGAPGPLAKLHAQASDLLGGGADAYRARIESLRGYPVVVNKWGSWCPPCRAEFPFFQRQAVKRGKRVAFLGVDGQDNDAAARKFLREFPTPFPHYVDPDLKIATAMKAVAAFPSTVFYDRRGRIAFVRQGGYSTERKLVEDIERYAR